MGGMCQNIVMLGIQLYGMLSSVNNVMNTGGYGQETLPHDIFEDDKHGWWKSICHAGST